MRISASDYYKSHLECNLWECERLYCSSKTHRLLYRLCESVTDYGDDGKWHTGECPTCNREWDTKHEIELWKKDQLRRATWN